MLISKRLLVVILLLYICFDLKSDTVDNCVNSCNKLFEKYILELSDTEKNEWNKQKNNLLDSINVKFKETEDETKYFVSEYKYLGAYKFLNMTSLFQMKVWTEFVNNMGQHIYEKKAKVSSNDSLIAILDKEFTKYKNSINASLFYNDYEKFLQIKSSCENPTNYPILLSYTYSEEVSPYDKNPQKHEFIIYDWLSKINELNTHNEELLSIIKNIDKKEYLVIKDENYLFPIILSIFMILVSMPSFFETYGFKYNKGMFALMVLLSLLGSVILVYINSKTWINCILSVIVPGLFYLCFYLRKHEQKEDI